MPGTKHNMLSRVVSCCYTQNQMYSMRRGDKKLNFFTAQKQWKIQQWIYEYRAVALMFLAKNNKIHKLKLKIMKIIKYVCNQIVNNRTHF